MLISLNVYRIYEISEINDKNEKKILCYRRYNNFDLFYNKIKKKFPFYLIPKLIGKNPLNKFLSVDEEFYNKRRRQLNYFLNFVYSHPKLKNSKEFLKFLRDPECDDEYFKKEETIHDFPEASKVSSGITQKFFGIFSNYFTVREENMNINENDRNIKNMEIFYKNIYEKLKEIKNYMSSYIYQLKKTGENYESLANNFLYMKDVTFDSQLTKDHVINYYSLTSELAKINKLHYEDTSIDLEDKFEGFISILAGLCEIFERYEELIKNFTIVNRAIEDSKINTRSYDKHKLYQEERRIKELKIEFEENIYNEVKEFKTKYQNVFIDIVENFKLLIKSINSREIIKLQNLVELK